MNIPAVAFLPASIDACALYRMFLPHLHTPNSMFHFKEGAMTMDAFAHCKVAVVQRLCTESNFKAIGYMKQFGMKVIYDLDDNLWAVPSYNPASAIFKKMESGFRFCAAECDMITVSTAPLKVAAYEVMKRNKHKEHIPPIEVVNNAMDFNWMAPVPEQFRKKKDGKVILGWAGTNTHTGDVEKVFSLLPKLVNEIENLYLEFVGLPAPIKHQRVSDREFVPISEWPMRWASWQWDISIAPLDMNKFNTSKSNIKMLEAAALGIPCLVSPAPPYKDFCRLSKLLSRHLLCETTRDWETKARDLILNESLRKEVGQEMRRVASFYDISTVSKKWHELFESLV